MSGSGGVVEEEGAVGCAALADSLHGLFVRDEIDRLAREVGKDPVAVIGSLKQLALPGGVHLYADRRSRPPPVEQGYITHSKRASVHHGADAAMDGFP